MKAELKVTGDGSHTLYVPELNENYHSVHGAIAESRHVFLAQGLEEVLEKTKDIRILEIGFGTGLNAMLTFLHAKENDYSLHYTAIEAFPLPPSLIKELNYPHLYGSTDAMDLFESIHSSAWEEFSKILPEGFLKKVKIPVIDFSTTEKFNLIYFDAFAPEKQPEMWDIKVFEKISGLMEPGGVLVTYCAKGEVRRKIQQTGLSVERVQGPPGKREMIRAFKIT